MNAYRGVNAHLHSALQATGNWSVFHSTHITHLSDALQDLLPPESGYYVLPEKSLQIVRDDITGPPQVTFSRPDIGVYKSGGGRLPADTMDPASPGAVVPLTATLHDPEDVMAVAIYRATEDGLGDIVTRIELLSPANKPPGSHYPQYLANRDTALKSGINLVEIDYLHARRSVLAVVPDYPAGEAQAYPYVIAVSSPQPTLEAGETRIYGFRVDDPIPRIALPLAADESITFDLDSVYQTTFKRTRAFAHVYVDYSAPPANFDAYDAEDQRRIHDVMRRAASTS
jgi:hypothetical protein